MQTYKFEFKLTFPVFIQSRLYHLFYDKKFNWLISVEDLSKLFDITKIEILNILDNQDNRFIENRHFIKNALLNCAQNSDEVENKLFLISKKGVVKIAYYLNNIDIIDILDELEDINFSENCLELAGQKNRFFSEIELILNSKLEEIKKDSSVSLEKINDFINTIGILIQKENEAKYGESKIKNSPESDFSLKNIFLNFIEESLNKSSQFQKETNIRKT